MIFLAEQTGEIRPLIKALNALHSARRSFTIESTPRENAEIQQLMGDTLLKIGRKTDDVRCLEHAIKAYRGAITFSLNATIAWPVTYWVKEAQINP